MPTRFIGQTTALMPEASTPDEPRELIDGESGDTNFPYANFKVLATVGEIDPVTKQALTGYPDGNAAWLRDNKTVRVAYQSESYATMSNETYPWRMKTGVKFTGSHLHYIDYDRAKFANFLKPNSGTAAEMFKSSGHLFNRVFNVFGQEVKPKTSEKTDLAGKWGNQTNPDGTLIEFISGQPAAGSTPAIKDMRLTEGDFFFHSFCGAYYENANKYGTGVGFADDIWLMGEEWNIGDRMFADPDGSGPLNGSNVANNTMGLASLVVDVKNGIAYTAPALGQSGYEKLMPINSGSKDYVVIVASGYNHGVEPAPLKIYIGRKNLGADGKEIDQKSKSVSQRDKFLARNGLLYGQLYGMAANAQTYQALGIKTVDADIRMLDEYLKNSAAPANFSARYYPTTYRWDGFSTPEAVKDTEIFQWAQDGDVILGNKEINSQPVGYTFFNSDSKVEHPAADPDLSKSRYIQNHTATGGLLGIDFFNIKNELVNDADKNLLPDYLSANVTRILSGADGALTVDTGGKGIGHFDEKVNPDKKTAAKHIKTNSASMVAPDGLLWVKSSDADVLIVDEDSGNDYGERKFALRIDPVSLNVLPSATGYFLAQAGGTKNPRAIAKVAANPGDFEKPRNSEFSGSWDVTALVARKNDGSFYTQKELKGSGRQLVEQSLPLNRHVFIGVLQQSGESAGAVKDNKADYGGQILQFSIDIPTGLPVSKLSDNKGVSFLNTTSASERDALTNAGFTYKDVAFKLPLNRPLTLHTFYGTETDSHPYTLSEAERVSLATNPSSEWKYDCTFGKPCALGIAPGCSTPDTVCLTQD